MEQLFKEKGEVTSFRVLNNNSNDNDEYHNYWIKNAMFDIFNDKECYDYPSSNPINNASNEEWWYGRL